MKILVTGVAGFVGMHVAKNLLENGHDVVGLDNLNSYYDQKLKLDRIKELENPNFKFVRIDLSDRQKLIQLFIDHSFSHVINLAAQAGVRYSIENPQAYVDSNLVGFTNILEACRNNNIEHLIYASSSSVYGANQKMPFSTNDSVNHPVSLYAATKKANELLAHSYSDLYDIPTTGLRFFTVYGPWGRPDMAYFSFTKNILKGETIKVFNNGEMMRDFTYIDDIVKGIVSLLDQAPKRNDDFNRFNPNPSTSYAPYKIYNIGNNKPVKLMYFINLIEKSLDKKANIELLPMQAGDVQSTYADIEDLKRDVGFNPSTSIEEGLNHFIDWYKVYYKL